MPIKACRGGGSLPSKAFKARICIAAPKVVAQPQAVQQLAESAPCMSETHSPAHHF